MPRNNEHWTNIIRLPLPIFIPSKSVQQENKWESSNPLPLTADEEAALHDSFPYGFFGQIQVPGAATGA
jgi:hypothetical protein